jgi:N-carbamoylputrescine amidase
VKIALIQMNSNKSRDENVRTACDYIDQAAIEKPDLVVLPEFFNNLYFFQYRDYSYLDWAERDDGYTISRMKEMARAHKLFIIATIYEEHAPGVYYDTAMVIDPQGTILGKYRKTHPSAVRSLEKIYFRFGSKYSVFKIKDWTVGIVICYDTYFPESVRSVTLNGAELVVIPFAAPYKEDSMRSHTVVTRAYENGVYVAACNKVGPEGDWTFGGDSLIVDPFGKVLAEAEKTDDKIIIAELNSHSIYEARKSMPMLRDRRPDLYTAITTPTEDLP